MSELPQVKPARCMFLSSKAMAVYGEAFENDPDFQAGLSDVWCVQTSRALGPDNGEVGLAACCDPGRECYREY
ncbi:MAG: hypothetical protein ACJ8F7_11795 [Gemmataceae bacterium]